MTQTSFRKSWMEPRIDFGAAGNRLIVTVKPDTSELLKLIQTRSIDVPYCPPESRAGFASLGEVSNRIYVLSRLLVGLHHLNPQDGVWNGSRPIRVVLSHAYHLPDDGEVALVVSLHEHHETVKSLPPEAAARFNQQWLLLQGKIVSWEMEDEKRKREGAMSKHEHPQEPTLLSVVGSTRLLDALPTARYVKDFPKGRKNRRKAIQCSIAGSELAPSREGIYALVSGVDVAGQEVALIVWDPQSDLPGYPELRACLAKSLPAALKQPRRSRVTPPHLFDQDVDMVISNADLSLLDGIDNQTELPQAHDYRLDYDSVTASIGKALIQKGGFDAVGWYQGFHFWDEQHWGIYLHAERVVALACSLYEDLSQTGNQSPTLAIFLAVGLVYQHELFHARVEAAATWIETLRRKATYRAYHNDVYECLKESEDWREEALANWASIDWVRRRLPDWHSQGIAPNVNAVERTVADLLDISPAGYREWRKGSEQHTWRRLGSELVTAKQGGCVLGKALPVEALLRGNLPFDLRNSDIPTRLIGNSLVSDIFFSAPSRREAEKLLRHYHYRLDTKRGKGSHEFWEGQDGRGFSLPKRDPLSVRVFHALLEHFGLTKTQYVSELRSEL